MVTWRNGSSDPRDVAIRAAWQDAGRLAGMLGDMTASYRGPLRDEYLSVLSAIVADLGGTTEPMAGGFLVTVRERRIRVTFL